MNGCPHTTSPEPCAICKAGDELAEAVKMALVRLGRYESKFENADIVFALKAYRKARGER